ncbi:GNAT family N-acetyltransferase [Solicola sp. PLA-1-18]|uniref:GNAT family N-acetyltransferase n=1 Tax=Solicola sp. PLA-1-18 TaxID=3380532 RepID=UPI003B7DDB67
MTAPPQEWTRAPDLDGDLVRLTALDPAHAPGLLAAADDDEIFRWTSYAPPADLGDVEAMVADHLARPAATQWTQVDLARDAVAGITTFYEVDPGSRSLAIGYTWLSRASWRSGVNTESKLLLLTRAFETLGAVRVVWHVDSRNERSVAAVERLGATREGLLRKHKLRRDGTWRDTVQLALVDDEWAGVKERLQGFLARRR